MAEGARLESVFTREGDVGSDPTLSASFNSLVDQILACTSVLSFCADPVLSLCRMGAARNYDLRANTRRAASTPGIEFLFQAVRDAASICAGVRTGSPVPPQGRRAVLG